MISIGRKYCFGVEKGWPLLIPLMLMMLAACRGNTAVITQDSVQTEEIPFHADNDIAMIVSSLVDAVRVGESLDGADYDFQGILTDGQGTPLYTDIEGNPGEWSVVVISDEEARISNLNLGDLLTEDLRNYIAGSLNLNEADLATAYVNPADEQEFIWLYDMGDVQLSFSETLVKMEDDLDGTIMSVSVFKR